MLVTLLIGAIFLTNTARAQQDIQVSTATTALTSGVSSFDFGDVMIDYPVIYSFIVENVGDADLTLASTNSVTFGGADPVVFSSQGLDGTVLAAGEIDVFTISFIPVASGMKSTIVTVESDDPDEGSFTFTVAGNAIDKPASCIIPNGGFEFSNTVALPQLDFFASTASGVTEYETPAGWSSAFGIVAALFGLDVNVSITADARTGSGALELVGDGTNFGDVLTALPCSASQAPATLQGYYKFTGAPTDSAMIAVSTGGGVEMNRTDANSDTLYIDSDASTYTMFQIDFPYDANSVDSLLVHIFTTNNGVSTVFKVDDLEITMAPGAADENPIFVSSNSASYAENGTGTVLDIDANDGDGGAVDAGITYSLSGGADQAEFDIDVNNGALTFISSPDFENPTDANADNAYIVQVTASDGVNTTDQTVTITVTDVNEVVDNAPVFISANTASYAENGTGTVLDIDANDGDGGAVDAGITYSLSGGADQAEFDIDVNNGALTFISSPDFENPTDANADNAYIVQVTASDGVNTTDQTVTITVTDVNEVVDNAPVFISANTASYAENGTGTVLDIDANDGDGGAVDAGITYSLSGGADQAEFDIDVNNGALTFISSPDFENPTDANADNAYIVQVTANDGVNTTDQTVTITVVNLNDLTETITGIFDDLQNDNLKLFPNPVSDSFSFSDVEFKIDEVIIYTLNGKLVKQFNNFQSQYHIKDLNAGSYLIRVKAEGQSYFQRLLKE